MKITAVIPARYASTRFEGKALADINAMRVEIKESVGDRARSPDVMTTRPIDFDKH